jgi:valyl-tRNA synthetase
MHKDFLKPYDHTKTEKAIYKSWEKSGYFNPDKLPKRTGAKAKPFTIIMPPPNANGSLHVGHAVGLTLQDLMIRYHRLKGDRTLWLPGADHAGFETQVVFEKKLEKEGTSRFEILQKENGREELYKMIWDFTQANKSHMEGQIRELGSSCDWSRGKFTLDPKVVKVVYETFKKLYDEGLVYRAKRIVSWCVKHQTTLSDLEVAWEERNDKLYYVRYKSADNTHNYLVVATTRPETIPGDVAIAVHPEDKRLADWIGRRVIEPITKKQITVVADEAVEREFGTGALKITPAHDPVDFEVGKRHNLETIATLDLNGRFNDLSGPFVGMKVAEARESAVRLLEECGCLEKMEDYKHQVGVCYKCKGVVEPMILPQWFIDLTDKGNKRIVQPALKAVRSKKVRIVPDYQEKIFYHWMENIRDWNISRQIAWGIPIPVWYCEGCGKDVVVIDNKKPKKCAQCGSANFRKETDVFDTWFSSGQWPFATLLGQKANPEKDFEAFYPTSVMETGHDILFFWVARMIMLGLYRTGKIPFSSVYLHGMVRDKDRQKMSKSKGNVIDPLGIVEQYGADALRMALVIGNSPGQDIIISEEKIRGYRNFSNKIWNIARFILSNAEADKSFHKAILLPEDKKLLAQLEKVKAKVAKDIEKFRFSQAGEAAYHYVWHTLADKIIESKKKVLASEDKKDAKKQKSARRALYELLVQSLVMLHPFMPFVTEAVYQDLPKKGKKFLMVEEWS